MRTPSRSASGQTTHPAECTDCSCVAQTTYFIQWVFPSASSTILSSTPRVLGRDRACDTPLFGNQTSRRHARVQMDGPVPMIEDEGSRNGVFVNGSKVARAGLSPGDVLRLGDWIGLVMSEGLPEPGGFTNIVPGWYGGSRLASVVEPAKKIAPTDLSITIQGETGVGKEGLARAIHAWSNRSGAFVPVNCAALPASLAESELFGHAKGAFTGADRPAVGLFRAAHGGTLFLDEVLELPCPLQAKLLRAIEAQEVFPLGEARPVGIDVRIVAASQEPLDRAVAERGFRLDLKARLDGLTVVLPPLRQRCEDIAPLFIALLQEKSGGRPPDVEPKLIEQLLLYDWPLNVREVVFLVKRLLALHSTEPVLKRVFLPEHIVGASAAPLVGPKPARTSTREPSAFEALAQALRDHGGNVARAAASLGISRARAYRLLDARPDFELASIRPPGERQ